MCGRAGTGWTTEGTNNITDPSVYLTLLTNIPAMQWSTGPMVYVTVTPVNGPVDTDDCGVLSIWGGGMDVDYSFQLATETYDTVYVTGGCGGGDAMEEGLEDGIPLNTEGTELDSLCDPDLTGAASALRIAGGLDSATPADVLLYDLDVDGRVTLLDAAAVLRACPHVLDRRFFYVQPGGVDDEDHGTLADPWETLDYAMEQLDPG